MYLLDTNICSYLMKRSFPVLVERVKRFAPGELKVSVITAFELEYGAQRSGRYAALQPIILGFLDNVEILGFDVAAAREAGAVRAELAAVGKPIGAYDTLIAGHARALKAILVTHNVDEFARVAGLKIEDWVTAPP
jgi:tRNA(fMet)-specific endonuclease VapC